VKTLAALLAAVLLPVAALAATPEDRLSEVYASVEANRLDEALGRVDALLRDYPNFRLAHLVRGDLLLARARPLETFGNVVKTVPQEKVEGLRAEALRGCAPSASAPPTTARRARCCSSTRHRSTCCWSTRAARGCTSSPTTAAGRATSPTTT
jgi:hypothetical protein